MAIFSFKKKTLATADEAETSKKAVATEAAPAAKAEAEEVSKKEVTKTSKAKAPAAASAASDDASTGAADATPKKKRVGAKKDDINTVTSLDGQPVKEGPMHEMATKSATPPSVGDTVEGKVVANDKTGVYVDLSPFGTGLIFGREYITARDIIKKINPGDTVAAKIVDLNGERGYIELSLKEARQALIWAEAEQAIAEKRTLDLPVREANKGGLIIEWQGIQGFLPASQLKAEHYPRVNDADKDKILEELRKFIGQRLSVTIITAIPKEAKLIFSEKDPEEKEKGRIIEKYQVGDTVEGEVTGIVDFGVFVKLEEGLEGLVHISEIDWSLVEDPRTHCKVRDKVKVKIIDIKEGKISLSLKALKENPWKQAAAKYKKDQTVNAVIIKYNKHGALASIEEGIAGLVHISEFGSEEKLREKLELGKAYPFKITLFDPKEQKMALSFAAKESKK